MSATAPLLTTPRPAIRLPGLPLALGFVGLALGSAALAGLIPLEFSIATVFLFAGPHNWLEARYVLGRLPARVGKLRGFFVLSAVGIVGLTAGVAAGPGGFAGLGGGWGETLYAGSETAFLFLVAAPVC